MTLTIEKSGLGTSIQDVGRANWQHMGVPLGGAADSWAMQCANWLAGNAANSPVLEMALFAPQITFSAACTIALCGADLSFKINNRPIAINASIQVNAGDILTSGLPKFGCYCYLAVGGKWQVSRWLNSTSPLTGNAILPIPTLLQKGDTITIDANRYFEAKVLPLWAIPSQNASTTVRYTIGPEGDENLHDIPMTVLPNSNRMGLRCATALTLPKANSEMISSPVLPGTIQLTPAGQCIVLGVDAQTTGGYPRIGQVIAADLDALAQLPPHAAFTLKKVDVETALAALKLKAEVESRLWALRF